MTELTNEMKEGLAQVYSNKGFRAYLEHRIGKANQALIECLAKNELEEAKRYAQRMQMMSELLSKGREQFNNFEKINANNKSGSKSQEKTPV